MARTATILPQAPMLWFLLPLALGIASANFVVWPLAITFAALLLLLLLLFWVGRVELLYPIIFLFGLSIASLSAPAAAAECRNVELALRVGSDNTAEVVAERIDSEWGSVHYRVALFSAEQYAYRTIVIRGDVLPLLDDNGYLASLRSKGCSARVVVRDVVGIGQKCDIPLMRRANMWALSRLERLGLTPDSFALSAALSLAYRKELSRAVVESYNRSGTAHLLALSGLHIGIVLLIISVFTYFLPLLRNGHLYADVIAILLIWLFVVMAGGGHSVVRAASMFTIMRLAWLLSRRYNPLNALFTAAVIILCVDSSSLYDLGFQLSFVAVLAILLVGAPIIRLLTTRLAVVDVVVASVVIGVVSTLATAPLISHSFGYLSLLSPLTTLPLLLTLSTIILSSLIWILCPIGLLQPFLWWVVEVSATIQNYVVMCVSSWGVGFIDYRLSSSGVAVCYFMFVMLYLAALLLVKSLKSKRPQLI